MAKTLSGGGNVRLERSAAQRPATQTGTRKNQRDPDNGHPASPVSHSVERSFDGQVCAGHHVACSPGLARFRPQTHRLKTFKISNDPHFADKVVDVVELYEPTG